MSGVSQLQQTKTAEIQHKIYASEAQIYTYSNTCLLLRLFPSNVDRRVNAIRLEVIISLKCTSVECREEIVFAK